MLLNKWVMAAIKYKLSLSMAGLRTFANVVGLSDNLKLAEHLRYLSERILKLETTLERE